MKASYLPAALVAALLTLASLPITANEAQAHRTVTMYEYFGAHPIPAHLGAWCDRDDLHVHSYALNAEEYLLYEIDGVFHFVGDSYLHQGHRQNWYYDPHPIAHLSTHWCVMEGPHAHWWQPAHRSHRTWISYDGYWVWEGAYTSAFWWTWSTWYDPFWRIHNRRINSHRHYHPGRHYHEHSRARPRYDGRHRHIHSSDHRMRGATERHIRWSRHRSQEPASESRTRAASNREASEPRNLGNDPTRSRQTKDSTTRSTGYRLPASGERSKTTQSTSSEPARAKTSVLPRKSTGSTGDSSGSQVRSNKPKAPASSSTIPNYRKATTVPSQRTRSSKSGGSSYREKNSSSSSTRTRPSTRTTTIKPSSSSSRPPSQTTTSSKKTRSSRSRGTTTKTRSRADGESNKSKSSSKTRSSKSKSSSKTRSSKSKSSSSKKSNKR